MSKSTRQKLLVAAGILFLILVLQFFVPNLGQGQVTRMESTGHSVSYNFDDSPSFHAGNSNFVHFVTRYGLSYRNSNMVIRWSESFNFTRPISVARGDIVAVGEERGGRRIYVFNDEGLMYNIEFENAVSFFSVNELGLLSVVVQTTFGHYVRVYSPLNGRSQRESDFIFYSRIVGDLLYPILVEVSPSGRYVVIASLDTRTTLQSVVEFRYLTEADAITNRATQGFIAHRQFHRELVTTLQFMEGERLIVGTTSDIICFRLVSRMYDVTLVQEEWRITPENNIAHIAFYNSRYVAYVTGDRRIGAVDPSPVGTVYVLNLNNDNIGTFSIGRPVTHFSMAHGAMLIGADRNFHARTLRGAHIWEHNVIHEVRDVIFLGNTDTILVAGANRAEVHERRRVRAEENTRPERDVRPVLGDYE